MSRVRAFFVEEGMECLAAARAAAEARSPGELHGAVRRLRGSAELARFSGIAAVAGSLEERLRQLGGGGAWSPDLGEHALEVLRRVGEALEEVRAGTMEPDMEGNEAMDGEVRAEGVVGIEELEYRGNAALERAAELRVPLEDAIVAEAAIGPLLDELFDLIRLGMK